MTQDDIIKRGVAAELLLSDDNFITLWESVVEESSKEILATPLDQPGQRENIYLTVAGGRYFINKLVHYKNLGDTATLQRKIEAEDEEGDEN